MKNKNEEQTTTKETDLQIFRKLLDKIGIKYNYERKCLKDSKYQNCSRHPESKPFLKTGIYHIIEDSFSTMGYFFDRVGNLIGRGHWDGYKTELFGERKLAQEKWLAEKAEKARLIRESSIFRKGYQKRIEDAVVPMSKE